MSNSARNLLIACVILLVATAALGCICCKSPQRVAPSPSVTPDGSARATATVPTATPIPVGLSKDNPASVGSSVTYTDNRLGFTATITVEEARRGAEALRMLQAASMSNGEPEDPSLEYLLVKAKFELARYPGMMVNGQPVRTLIVWDSDWYAVSDGKVMGNANVACPEPKFGGTIPVGGMTEGWFCVPVYKDDPRPYVEFGTIYANSDATVIWYRI